jgi:hypothetical protein
MKAISVNAYQPCKNEKQFQHLGNLTDPMMFTSEDIIFKMTGCMPTCNRWEFNAETTSSLTDHNSKDNKE